jgi:hypothetical protein
MKGKDSISGKAGFLLGLIFITLASGCIVAPDHGGYHEGYYDRDHHRWYHEHGWVDCHDGDEHCH